MADVRVNMVVVTACNFERATLFILLRGTQNTVISFFDLWPDFRSWSRKPA